MKFLDVGSIVAIGAVILCNYGKIGTDGSLVRMPKHAMVNGQLIDCTADSSASWRTSNGWLQIVDEKPQTESGQIPKVTGYEIRSVGGVNKIHVKYQGVEIAKATPLEIAESIKTVSTANLTMREKTALLEKLAEYVTTKK